MVKKEEVLNHWLNEQIKIELIVKSSSRYVILYFYILKKNRFLQLVQDYRKLNQYIIRDKTLLLLIREVINKLKYLDIRYFSKLDLIQRYNNIQIKEGDEWKAAYLTNKGLYQI